MTSAPSTATATPAADTVVRVENVSKRFGKLTALDAVSFDIPRGSIFGLLGPNGAGKTTLFSIIANFLHADKGTIRVLDHDTRDIGDLCGRMSILPQDASFERSVPILEQLVFFRRLAGLDARTAEKEATEALDWVGLSEKVRRTVRALSHGMVKRLGVAQAFMGAPEVILLDEPTSGLDPANARQVRDLVRSLQGRATVVVSSHNLAEIQEMCSHVAILDHGRVVTTGSVEELTRSARELELEFRRPLGEADSARLAAFGWAAEVVSTGPASCRVLLSAEALGEAAENADTATAAVLGDLIASKLVPRGYREGASLERIFLSVTQEAARETAA
jgi:ABC-type multidrug transport system ATPase subunit